MTEAAMQAKLKAALCRDSYEHSLRTVEAAGELACLHGVDEKVARTAGLIHDVAKDLSDEQLLEKARAYGIRVYPVEAKKPYLLHAAVSAEMAASDYGIEDAMIIRAIRNHTFGDTKMNKLDKIVYLADVIEPARGFDGLAEIRRLAKIDLDQAFAQAYRGQLIFIIKKGGYLHPRTLSVWNEIAGEVREVSERTDNESA